MEKLKPSNFFKGDFYILKPWSQNLSKKDQTIAWTASIVIGFLTLGLAQASFGIFRAFQKDRVVQKGDALSPGLGRSADSINDLVRGKSDLPFTQTANPADNNANPVTKELADDLLERLRTGGSPQEIFEELFKIRDKSNLQKQFQMLREKLDHNFNSADSSLKDNANARAVSARLYFFNSEKKEAATQAEKALVLDETCHSAEATLGAIAFIDTLASNDDLKRASESLSKALEGMPEDKFTNQYMGFVSVNKGNLEEAKKYLNKAGPGISEDGVSPPARYIAYLAAAQANEATPKEMEEIFEALFKTREERIPDKQFDILSSILYRVLQKDDLKENANLWAVSARLQFFRGYKSEAGEQAKKALDLDENCHWAHATLGAIHLKDHKYASKRFSKALEGMPEDKFTNQYVGFFNVVTGNLKEAKEYLDKANPGIPENTTYQPILHSVHLAVIKMLEGNLDEGYLEFTESMDEAVRSAYYTNGLNKTVPFNEETKSNLLDEVKKLIPKYLFESNQSMGRYYQSNPNFFLMRALVANYLNVSYPDSELQQDEDIEKALTLSEKNLNDYEKIQKFISEKFPNRHLT